MPELTGKEWNEIKELSQKAIEELRANVPEDHDILQAFQMTYAFSNVVIQNMMEEADRKMGDPYP